MYLHSAVLHAEAERPSAPVAQPACGSVVTAAPSSDRAESACVQGSYLSDGLASTSFSSPCMIEYIGRVRRNMTVFAAKKRKFPGRKESGGAEKDIGIKESGGMEASALCMRYGQSRELRYTTESARSVMISPAELS